MSPDQVLEAGTLERLAPTPIASLHEARVDAKSRRLDGIMNDRSDFAEPTPFYVEHGIPADVAEQVAAEAELSGYWTGRRALDNLDQTYACDDASTDRIYKAVNLLPIEDVVPLGVDWDDEQDLLRQILAENGVEENEDTIDPPLIGFDTGFTFAVVEYDLATFGISRAESHAE